MANTSYDTLTIKIEADSKQANSNVKNLSNNLRQLDKSAKELNTRRLGEVRGLLLHIAKIDFSNVSQGLRDVVKAFNAFNSKKFMNATSGGANLSGAYKTDPNTFLNLENVVKNLDLATPISVGDQAILKYKAHLQEVSDTINKGNWFENFSQGLDKVKKGAENTKQVAKSLKSVKNETEKANKSLKKMLTSFGRILKYRVIRKIIQEIFQALVQGTQNVIAFDSATAQSFNRIRDSLQFLTDALGTMIAPLMQLLEPVIVFITDAVANLANSFGELFAEINGQSGYAKAIKGEKDWANAMKKTQSVGIDELNVLSQDQNNGNFEQAEVKATSGAFAEIKDAFSTILSTAKDFISNVLPKIKKVLEPVLKIVGNICELIDQLVQETFADVHSSIGEFIDMIASIFDFVSNIVENLMPSLRQVISVISVVINIINSVLGLIFNRFGEIFELLKPVVNIISAVLLPVLNVVLAVISTIAYVIEAMIKTIKDFFTLNWSKIGDDWKDMAEKVGEAWKSMASGNAEIYAKLGVEGYATGGFPREDGLFFANHNELIGQFSNGQTAVANNEQITEGIYQAVLSAMRESGGAGGEIVINLDGYEMAKVITKRQNNFGTINGFGGNISYGK